MIHEDDELLDFSEFVFIYSFYRKLKTNNFVTKLSLLYFYYMF